MKINNFLRVQFSTTYYCIYNLSINILPNDYFSNRWLRPTIARIFGLRSGINCQIRKNICYENPNKIIMGNNVLLNRYLFLDACEEITIGNNIRFGPNVSLITGTHHISQDSMRTGKVYGEPIVIEDGCWIGASALIGPGVTIGAGSIVSAGAVVMRSMPSNYLIAGNPARPIKILD